MYSLIMAENLTEIAAITICGTDGVIFSDILSGSKTGYRSVSAGSARLEIYDNHMRQIAVLWLPLAPGAKAKLSIYPDLVQFTLMR